MIREIVPPDTGLAYRTMRELRTHVADERSFAERIDTLQRPEGYRLAGAFEEDTEHAVAVGGFRVLHNLAWGRCLYLDDLSTLPDARGRGHAGALLDWLLEEARRERCEQFHLDSGVQLARADAHRLYLNKGFVISAHHFSRDT